MGGLFNNTNSPSSDEDFTYSYENDNFDNYNYDTSTDNEDSGDVLRILIAVVTIMAILFLCFGGYICKQQETTAAATNVPNNARPAPATNSQPTTPTAPTHNLLETMTATERNSYVSNVLNTKVSRSLEAAATYYY